MKKKTCYMSFAPLAFFFVILFFADISFAARNHRCVFDRVLKKIGPQPVAFVRELPQKGRRGVNLMTTVFEDMGEWSPIRFGVFVDDMNNPAKYCAAVDQEILTIEGKLFRCTERDILTNDKRDIIVNRIIPLATKMHTERLLVNSLNGRIIVPKYKEGLCTHFTIPDSHHLYGVEGADIVLYASAGPIQGEALAWAAPCSALFNGRPVIGVMYFSPQFVLFSEYTVRVTAHEIAHALGFNVNIMRNLGMVTSRRGVRGKREVLFVRSRNTLSKAREHYNCERIPGMELEDEGGEGTAESHWERRNAKDELMAGVAGIGYYTEITMAAFEDMRFYRINWSMAETMNWGKNAGCKLLTEKCLVDGVTAYPDMFCNNTSEFLVCTSDRLALGSCSLVNCTEVLAPHYRYFKEPGKCGDPTALSDYCPFIEPYENTRCTDGQGNLMPGSIISPTSRCVKGQDLAYNEEKIGDACVDVYCNDGAVYVRYLGSDMWLECPPGGSFKPMGNFTGGHIVCPKYTDVCFDRAGDWINRESRFYAGSTNGNEYKEKKDGVLGVFLISWAQCVLLFIFALSAFGRSFDV